MDLESDTVIVFHELGLLCSRVSGLEIGVFAPFVQFRPICPSAGNSSVGFLVVFAVGSR